MEFGGLPPEDLIPPDPTHHSTGFSTDLFPSDTEFPHRGEYAELKNLMVDGGGRFGVSAIAFDGQEEMLWMGNHGGHVTSYYGTDLQKYTSFQVHETNEIRQLLTMDGRIFSLTSDGLRCHSKFGRPQFKHLSESLVDMQCMLQTGPSTILMGGHQSMVVEYDVETRTEIRKMEVEEPGCALLRFSTQYICAGDTSGKVTLRDPKTLKSEHVLQAHSGTLSDFDVRNNILVTCGFSTRMGSMTVDRFLMLYDLRFNKSLLPLQVTIEPMFLRIVPTYANRICAVSQSGQFQLIEEGGITPASLMVYQVQTEGAAVGAFDVSPSNQAFGFGDHGGYLHVFGAVGPEPLVYNPFAHDTEFPSVEEVSHSININDVLTPFSLIPMQYPSNGGKLLSDWPEDLCNRAYKKPPKLDPDVLRSVKMVQNVGYAPNPSSRRRNQAPYKPGLPRPKTTRKVNVPDSPLERVEDPFVTVPKRYRNVEIKYSKLGVEDFDFRYYNKTNYAGLETHIPNAYCNPMLQVLFFIEPFRVSLLGHLCDREFCLACELGFLYHMLDSQKGKTCQASNFLRAFRTIPEASALSLVLNDAEETMGKVNLQRLIQNWNRFILQQIHTEYVDVSEMTHILEKSGLTPLSPLSRSHSWQEGPEKDPQHDLSSQSLTEAQIPEEEEDEIKVKECDLEEGGEGEEDEEKKEEEETDSEKKERAKHTPEPLDLKKERLRSLSSDDGQNCSGGRAKDSIVKHVFGTDLENVFTCNKCGNVIRRAMTSSVVDLSYPELTATGPDKSPIMYTFAEVLQRTMCCEQNTQTWCNKCNKYQPHVQTKVIESLPDVLAINCHLESSRETDFWRAQEEFIQKKYENEVPNPALRSTIKACRYGSACTRKDCKFRHESDPPNKGMEKTEPGVNEHGWVPVGLQAKLLGNGKVLFHNIEDENDIPSEWLEPDLIYYELHATVSFIKDAKGTCGGNNMVSLVNVGERYHQRKERVTCTQWYLFNDIAITPVERQEAVSFHMDWKIPCVIYFMRRDINKRHLIEVNSPITSDLLLMNSSVVTPRRKHSTFSPLEADELPGEGSIIGLDAEFVTLNQEEAELRSDGTRSTIKPSQMSVARITCIRGSGGQEGEAFIDDYISTQDQVVDYLTQFSGIQPGDLDASLSSKHLTTLKSTYLKMRYLIDVGCIMVGHGLKKDFRVINLIIPQNQVVDTVELFHLPRQRMISLKFLAWYFLDSNIQSVVHDSIEDARTALKLRQKYKEMEKEGMDKVRLAIHELYEIGRRQQWKVPEGNISLKDILAEIEAEKTGDKAAVEKEASSNESG